MARKRYSSEQIISMLREAEVLLICSDESTIGRFRNELKFEDRDGANCSNSDINCP